MGWLRRPQAQAKRTVWRRHLQHFLESDDTNVVGFFTHRRAPDMTAWDAQAGIQRKFGLFGLEQLGETAFWGGYGQVNDGCAPGQQR